MGVGDDTKEIRRVLALKEFVGLGPMTAMGIDSRQSGTGGASASPLEASRLYQLARSKDSAARAELGDAVTDLFTTIDLSLREREIVSDILITMLKQAEKDLRRALADRLAVLPQAPLRVILHLSNDEIDVAGPILEKSPVLEDIDLMLIIEVQKSPYWQSIARRQDLKAPVVRALVDTKDPDTAVVLVKNDKAQIPADSYAVLAEMAAVSNDLTGPLLARADLPQDLIAVIYAHAGRKLERTLHTDDAKILDHVADITNEFVGAAQDEYSPTRLMVDAARILKSRGQLSVETMLQSLKNGQVASCIAQMMVFMDLEFGQVRAMLREPNGESLAAFCRLQRVDKKIFVKMFLMTQKYRSGERLVDPMLLSRALTIFDQMTLETCMQKVQKLRQVD